MLGPAVFNRHVVAIDVTSVLEPLPERLQAIRITVRRLTVEEPDYRRLLLLRRRRDRPSRRSAAEQRDELAPPDHSITSSARNKIEVGSVIPSALAVWRLAVMLNLVARSMGSSAGFAPLRILSTKAAARYSMSGKLMP